MAYAEDFSCLTMIAEAPFVRAIGWLDAMHLFAEGVAPEDFVEKLQMLVLHCDESELALGWPAAAGIHTCELCEDFHSAGNLGVPGRGVLFVAPEMILHYVTDHRYLPPVEFIEAVTTCPLPGTPAYAAAIAAFANSHPLDWGAM